MSETNLRKRRGVVRASITRLNSRIDDLEGKTHQESTLDLAQQAKERLEQLDKGIQNSPLWPNRCR